MKQLQSFLAGLTFVLTLSWSTTVLAGPILYSTVQNNLVILDPTTGSVLSTVGQYEPTTAKVGGLAFHPLSGALYAVENIGPNDNQLLLIDPLTASKAVIGGTGLSNIADLAFDASGTLYAITARTSQLHTLNLTTGQGTFVGSTGLSSNAGGLEFDLFGTLYYTLSGNLYTLNPATGGILTTTPIGVTINALTTDPSSGELYGTGRSGFFTLNPTNQIGAQFYDSAAFQNAPVPEPSTLLLLGAGLAAAGVRRYRGRT